MEFDSAGGEGEVEAGLVACFPHHQVGGGGVPHEFVSVAVKRAQGEADLLGAFAKLEKTADRFAAGEFLLEGGADDPDGLFQLRPRVVIEEADLDRKKGEPFIGGEAADGIVHELGVGNSQEFTGQGLQADAA